MRTEPRRKRLVSYSTLEPTPLNSAERGGGEVGRFSFDAIFFANFGEERILPERKDERTSFSGSF